MRENLDAQPQIAKLVENISLDAVIDHGYLFAAACGLGVASALGIPATRCVLIRRLRAYDAYVVDLLYARRLAKRLFKSSLIADLGRDESAQTALIAQHLG